MNILSPTAMGRKAGAILPGVGFIIHHGVFGNSQFWIIVISMIPAFR
jgi:hypothetical protein